MTRDRHTRILDYELAKLSTPERFGPGYVTDMCRCGHERGIHWDGDGACDPDWCGCRTFRPQQVD